MKSIIIKNINAYTNTKAANPYPVGGNNIPSTTIKVAMDCVITSAKNSGKVGLTDQKCPLVRTTIQLNAPQQKVSNK